MTQIIDYYLCSSTVSLGIYEMEKVLGNYFLTYPVHCSISKHNACHWGGAQIYLLVE